MPRLPHLCLLIQALFPVFHFPGGEKPTPTCRAGTLLAILMTWRRLAATDWRLSSGAEPLVHVYDGDYLFSPSGPVYARFGLVGGDSGVPAPEFSAVTPAMAPSIVPVGGAIGVGKYTTC